GVFRAATVCIGAEDSAGDALQDSYWLGAVLAIHKESCGDIQDSGDQASRQGCGYRATLHPRGHGRRFGHGRSDPPRGDGMRRYLTTRRGQGREDSGELPSLVRNVPLFASSQNVVGKTIECQLGGEWTNGWKVRLADTF